MSNWYSKKIEDLFAELNTSKTGLTDLEAMRRIETYGQNKLQTTKQVTIGSIFIEQFKSPLIYVLIVAAVIVFFLGDTIDGSIIIGIVLLNAIIGTLQEGKARNTLQALQNLSLIHI